jgi:amino acid permease
MGAGSQRGSVLTILSIAIGAGCLSLPWVFSRTGYQLGLAFLIFSAFVSYVSQKCLVKAALKLDEFRYPELSGKVLGHRCYVFNLVT